MLTRSLEYVQFQGYSLVSRFIQKLTRDPDSHSAVLDRERFTDKQLIEQWPHSGGIKSWMDYNNFSGHEPKTPYEIWSLEVTQDQYDFIMGHYRESARVKKEYDWSGIMAFGLKGKDDPGKTFCCEEMAEPVVKCFGWDRVVPATIHPGFWRNLLQAAGAKLTGKGLT